MITIQNLTKTYHTKSGEVEALRGISAEIRDGDIFGIIGLSGAGKSTLLRCIALLETPTSGSISIDGRDLSSLRGGSSPNTAGRSASSSRATIC